MLPKHETIRQNRWIRPFGTWLHHPNLWHFNRRSVAGGVAAGLFCGLIPGPLQMIGGALLAVLFRVNLPVAILVTLYTNPLTIVPLYFVAYQLGTLVTDPQHHMTLSRFTVPDMGWDNWLPVMMDWIATLGKPFAIGLPLLAIILALSGYLLVRLSWRFWVVWQWRKRGKQKNQLKGKS